MKIYPHSGRRLTIAFSRRAPAWKLMARAAEALRCARKDITIRDSSKHPTRSAPGQMIARERRMTAGAASAALIALTLGVGRPQAAAADAPPPVLKLTFTIDRGYDADHIVAMFRHSDPAGIESRARSMGIDLRSAKIIRDGTMADAKKLARRIVDGVVAGHYDEIETAKRDIRLKWADLLEPFSWAVTRSMQRPWRQPEYICVVSSVHPGLSDWHGNKVAIGYKQPKNWLRILGHEIVLSQAYQVMDAAHGGDRHELDRWQIWAFSEITAVLILDDPALDRFWPGVPRAGHYFKGSNYPQLADFEKQLKRIFDDRRSFDDFMAKAVPILQRYHHR
ncbi:MAG: hypothetical protein ACHQ51_06445 [Elusimicrobiota bacterium]